MTMPGSFDKIDPERLYSAAQAAAILGIAKPALLVRMRSGDLVGHRVGQAYAFPGTSLRNYIRDHCCPHCRRPWDYNQRRPRQADNEGGARP